MSFFVTFLVALASAIGGSQPPILPGTLPAGRTQLRAEVDLAQRVIDDPNSPSRALASAGQFEQLTTVTLAREPRAAQRATLAGLSGPAASALLNLPEDLKFGPDGKLYVADSGNNVVRRIDLSAGTIDRFAGTGKAGYSGDYGAPLQAQLDSPDGLAFDAAGNLYIADTLNNRIRIVRK